MCILCLEYQKEILTAKQVSKLFSELLIGGDTKHLEQFEEIGYNLSQDYKSKLNKEANENISIDDPDPFDPWP